MTEITLGRLDNLFEGKEKEVMISLIGERPGEVSYDFLCIDRAFRAYGSAEDSDVLNAVSPERHLLMMFKLLYVNYSIFREELLPLITSMYLVRTAGSIHRTCKSEIGENSVFAKVISKNFFDVCLTRYREMFTHIRPGNAVPIDIAKGMVLSIKASNSTPLYHNNKIFKIYGSESRIAEFDRHVANQTSAFTRGDSGIIYPRPVVTSGNMEDL
jgi:hypothetical protein